MVSRLEIMTVDGEKIVRTEKEVDLKSAETEVAEKKPEEKPANAPTLRRPGEQPEYPTDHMPIHAVSGSRPDNPYRFSRGTCPRTWPDQLLTARIWRA